MAMGNILWMDAYSIALTIIEQDRVDFPAIHAWLPNIMINVVLINHDNQLIIDYIQQSM